MKTIIFSLLFFISSQLGGQIVFQDKNKISGKKELQNLYTKSLHILDSLKTVGFIIRRMDILEINEQKYLLPDGLFDVYNWTGIGWKNLYRGIHHGYNYDSKKFVFNNNLYSFGGYGFWRSHGQVIQFLFDRGEWELLDFTKSLKNGYATTMPQGLMVFGDSDYIIDIDKKQITSQPELPFKMQRINNIYSNLITFDFDDFMLIFKKPMLLFDKKSRNFYDSELSPFRNLPNAYLVQIVSDSIALYDKNMSLIEATSVSREIKYFTPISKASTFRLKGKWIYSIISLLLLCCVYYFFRSKQKRIKFNDPLIEKLLPHAGKTLTQEELDEILGISGIKNPETHKGTRSQTINKINKETNSKTGKKLINRIKDPEDRRRYLYEIGNL
ncbi:MAG TPA: hypothetical protein ENI82_02275 [Bacteroidetes bacterium]|nr:hypothetical protein [Bacteroidota bacterium]